VGLQEEAEDGDEKKETANGTEGAKSETKEAKKTAPAAAWDAERIKEDLNLAQQLIRAVCAPPLTPPPAISLRPVFFESYGNRQSPLPTHPYRCDVKLG
jgi:hypothetical protein